MESRPSYLTEAETDLFFLAARSEPFWHAYFFIQYFYGLRLSDPASLRKDDVDFEHEEILISRGSAMACTVYPLVSEVKREILRVASYLLSREIIDGTYVFPSTKESSEKDRAVSRFTANSFFDNIWRCAGLPSALCYTDVLRESRRNHLVERGVPTATIEYLLEGARP